MEISTQAGAFGKKCCRIAAAIAMIENAIPKTARKKQFTNGENVNRDGMPVPLEPC